MPRGGARAGAGRPTLYPKTKRLSIRLSEKEIEILDKCVKITGTNRSDIISKGIVEIFEKLNHNQ